MRPEDKTVVRRGHAEPKMSDRGREPGVYFEWMGDGNVRLFRLATISPFETMNADKFIRKFRMAP